LELSGGVIVEGCGFKGEGGKRDLVLDVESKEFPALIAV
jgi:hypothetical protein